MFGDYTELVYQEYLRKMEHKELHPNLLNLTPAGVRDECLLVCEERYNKRDENVLRQFFGKGGEQIDYLKAIRNIDPTKFKPLISYLKDPSIDTSSKNIELLAWLIDFKDRPFELGKKYPPKEVEPGSDKKIEGGSSGIGPPVELDPIKSPRFNFRVGMVSGVALVAAILCSIILWTHKPTNPAPGPKPWDCMYWNEDHYESVNCSVTKGSEIQVIALDTGELAHFKKVTRPDTITYASIGSLWYVRYRGSYEYYTSGGFHPLDHNLRLKPLTAYIIRNHVRYSQDGEPVVK